MLAENIRPVTATVKAVAEDLVSVEYDEHLKGVLKISVEHLMELAVDVSRLKPGDKVLTLLDKRRLRVLGFARIIE